MPSTGQVTLPTERGCAESALEFVRRWALLCRAVDRIGWGDYPSLTLRFPAFCDWIGMVSRQFREILEALLWRAGRLPAGNLPLTADNPCVDFALYPLRGAAAANTTNRSQRATAFLPGRSRVGFDLSPCGQIVLPMP